MTQVLVPDSDIETSGWGQTPLWEKVDETGADDGSTISTQSSTPSDEDFQLGLTAGVDPEVSTGHVLRIRCHRQPGTPAGTIALELREGGSTVRATLGPVSPTTSLETLEYTLDGTETDAIGDYGDLSVRGVADNRRITIEWIRFEIPDPPAGDELDLAVEDDSAFDLDQGTDLELAAESDAALELDSAGELELPSEIDSTFDLDQAAELDLALETDTAHDLEQAGDLEQATETDSALEFDQPDILDIATELDIALDLELGLDLDQAVEDDSALSFQGEPAPAIVPPVVASLADIGATTTEVAEDGIRSTTSVPDGSTAAALDLEQNITTAQVAESTTAAALESDGSTFTE